MLNKDRLTKYEILLEEDLPDIRSRGTVLRHRKTGARIMLLENEDENKVFNIAFRTPPRNSTGVAHILEHSVLCGSREFPLKDPFVELVKGSLNTFLNAMTYPDKTCYPAASCNDQDFQNLMHVYLDAVFYPNIYRKEEIFRQEGWHYQLEEPDGPLAISGVVYNEMKGAFSSPDEVLERELMNSLFPDTPYGCESGGDPDHIPELTYEAFLEFHRTYYHPSNSFIYLYGNMDMNEKLDFLDEKYLSSFDHLDVKSQIPGQPPFEKNFDITKEYPIAEEEDEEENTYLSYVRTAGSGEDSVLCTAFEVLDYALLSAQGAPLQKALLEAKIGKDIYGSFEDGILQPYFTVIAKGARADQKDQFLEIVEKVLREQIANGIDRKALEAGISSMEFKYREADFGSYPKGLMYGLDILGNWIYSDEDPFSQVKLLAVFDYLKKAAGEGYFEKLAEKYLLSNPHGGSLTLVPKKGLQAEKEQKLAEELEAYKNSLSRAEQDDLVEKTAALLAYQEEEEDPENLRCIPMLKREDIKKETTKIFNEEYDLSGSLFLHHPVPSNGIAYLDLMFRISETDPEEIHYLGLLKSVLGLLDTGAHTYGDLCNEVNVHTGGMNFGVEIFESPDYQDWFQPYFSLKGKALYDKMPVYFELAEEVLFTSALSDTGRLYEIVAEKKVQALSDIMSGGHGAAVMRAASYSSKQALFQEHMGGISYYRFLEKLEREFDQRKEETVKHLEALLRRILRKENFCVSCACEEDGRKAVMELSEAFREKLYDEPLNYTPAAVLQPEKKNEGFQTSGQVQYVAQSGNFLKKGYAYTGALNILKVIMSYDYLWSNVRVKGGAYGCMSNFKRNGQTFFVSYRDPHLKRTLEIYRGIPDYVRNFTADEREMTKYVIGTISNIDVPKTPAMLGSISKTAYFNHVTMEMMQKSRDEILTAAQEDIRALAPYMEAVLSDEQICVLGSESAVGKAGDVLDHIESLVRGN